MTGPRRSDAGRRALPIRALCAALLLAWSAVRASAAYPEYAVKAALLVEIARFVTWPEASLGPPDAPFVVGTIGRDPMGSEVGAVAPKLVVHGRPVEVRSFAAPSEVGACHVLWIAASERNDLTAVLARTEGRPILTLSDEPGSVERGVHVTLVPKDGRIGFQVNAAAAERSGLRLSSDLLRLATVVEGRP